MKPFFTISCLVILSLAACSKAATLDSARVTQIQNEVRLNTGASAPSMLDPAPAPAQSFSATDRPAAIGDLVEGTKTLITGKKSRAELLFNDNTIARLGANSVFSFKPGSRDIELKSGFLLLHTPKGMGGANIKTPTAAAAVLGTTIMLSALPDGGQKLVVLEGNATITYNGVTQTVAAGQLVFLTAENGMSPPINIDLGKLVSSSGLINNLSGGIGSESLIKEAIQNQTEKIADGELTDSGFKIGGDQNGLNAVKSDSALQSAIDQLTDLDIHEPGIVPPVEDLTGTITVNPSATLNYANPAFDGLPTLTDADGVTHIGSFSTPEGFGLFGVSGSGGSDVFFQVDRVRITDGPPLELNKENVLSLNVIASGDSVNHTTIFDAILFENFKDSENGGNGGGGGNGVENLAFIATGGGIEILNTSLNSAGNLAFISVASEENPGDVSVLNSQLGRNNSFGTQGLFLEALGGSVHVDQSELNTRPLETNISGGFGDFGNFGIILSSLDGDVTVKDSALKNFVQAAQQFGDGFFESSSSGIYVASVDGKTVIENSQIQTSSDGAPSPVLLGGTGPNSYVLINQSDIISGMGTTAGPIDIIGNNVSVYNSTISAVSQTGAAAPVTVLANVINLTDTIIRGSTVALGNNSQTAMINFNGSNNFIWTDSGINGFFRNGTQTGNVQVGVNGQDGTVTVTPNTPVGGGGT